MGVDLLGARRDARLAIDALGPQALGFLHLGLERLVQPRDEGKKGCDRTKRRAPFAEEHDLKYDNYREHEQHPAGLVEADEVNDADKRRKRQTHGANQAENREPFTDFELEVNHIGDIDIYNGEIYAGVEYFVDGQGKNIQVAVYDASTLDFKRVFPFSEETGQMECCGIAVDPDSKTVYMASWIDDESSTFLYMYDLESGDFKGKLAMDPAPSWIQGVAYYDGDLYVTYDD